MKKLGLICCIWVFFVNYALGQQITAAEYFFDDDPGVGNATAINVTQGVSIDETFVIPTTGLSEGLHVLHIRTQDSDDVWSLYLRRYFFVNSIESYEDPTDYKILSAEYFIDDDPGVGNGTELEVTSGNTINENFSIPTVGLSEGLHVLHIRALDDNGTWGLYDRKYFYIHANTGYVNPTPYNIVEAEYFFNSDPGVGNGNTLAVTPSNSINESFAINTTGLPGGLHVLHIRAKDGNGTWSMYERRYFFIYTNDGYVEPTEYLITEAEYFFDNDPGAGNANPLSVTSGNTINESFAIDTSELEEGLHVLHIRAKDNNGTWSLYDRKYFYAMQPYNGPTPVQLVEAEYFLNDDPGVGNGTPIPVTPGTTLDEILVIPVECWNPDDYTLHIRIKDENDTWSHYMFDDFTVEEDMVPPTVITQDVIAELDASGNVSLTVDAIDNGSYDACGILNMSLDITDFNCSNLGENTVTLTVADNNNNVATNTAIVTVVDVTPPSVVTQNITVQLDEDGLATISENAVDNGSSDACGPLSYDTDVTSFDCSDLGDNIVTLTVTDGSENSNQATAIVTVVDTIFPTLQVPDNISTVTTTESCEASVLLPDVVFSDNCESSLSWEMSGAVSDSGNGQIGTYVFPLGTTNISFASIDTSGNTSTDAMTVVVIDNVLPSISNLPLDIDTTTDLGTCTAVVSWTEPLAIDNCTATITQISGLANGSQFPIGETIITYEVEDSSGNSFSDSFSVNVEDVENPLIENMPSETILDTEIGTCSASFSWVEPTADDNCSVVSFNQIAGPSNGSSFSLGETTVTYEAIDSSGNVKIESFIVIVNDNELPTISEVGDFEETLISGCDFSIPDYTGLTTVADNCGVASLVQTPSAGTIISGHNASQTITLLVTDNSGNTNSTSFVITLKGTSVYYADTDGDGFGDENNTIEDCELPVGYVENALDCDDTNENINPDATEIACNGIDENCNGMEDDDNIIPVCLTTDITVELDENTGQATIVANDVDNGSYDNCGIDSMTVSPSTFDNSNIGENEVILTIIDVNGNVAACQATVTVNNPTLSVEASELDDISIYPNPFGDKVIIKLPAIFSGSKFNIKLFDLRGRLVIDYQKQVINQQIIIEDLNQLDAAAYFIKIIDVSNGNFVQRKLIKH
ncbi:HYR domain-containing protein [Winogradskyella pulchriflava]|uniref:HYR domain-containing protein n=1 Tax=Winogradskyella pulchriflava TaxID=1110688 RepID=A0ABV6Q7D5_9FLAO